jgi:hypothetical protein
MWVKSLAEQDQILPPDAKYLLNMWFLFLKQQFNNPNHAGGKKLFKVNERGMDFFQRNTEWVSLLENSAIQSKPLQAPKKTLSLRFMN